VSLFSGAPCGSRPPNPDPVLELLRNLDLFDTFRWVLSVVVTVYASVITFQSLWGWYVWLTGGDRYISLLRRYVIVHGLRLRFTTFWGDVIICLLLCGVFLILWHAHSLIYDLGDRLDDVRQLTQLGR
jgi:hypothetical protein